MALLQLPMDERATVLERIGRARAWNILLALEEGSDVEFAALIRSIDRRRLKDFLLFEKVGAAQAAVVLSSLPIADQIAVLENMDKRRAWDFILLALEQGSATEFAPLLRNMDRRGLEDLFFLETTSRRPAIVGKLKELGIEVDLGRVLPTTPGTS
jgi:hypothetical protein